jgi:hypothetical protein
MKAVMTWVSDRLKTRKQIVDLNSLADLEALLREHGGLIVDLNQGLLMGDGTVIEPHDPECALRIEVYDDYRE